MSTGLAALVATCLIPLATAQAGEPGLAFRPDGEGRYSFDTGQIRGTLRADAKGMGLSQVIHVKTGAGLAVERGNMGLLSFYRSFSAGQRWGTYVCAWPKTAKLLPNGAVQFAFPAADDHPFAITATYRIQTPTAIGLTTEVRPTRDLERFEIFLGSYYAAGMQSLVYVRPNAHRGGKPVFLPADVNPLVEGTYLSFPRDEAAARIVLDGRWKMGLHPVQWSITRYLAAPMAMRRLEKHDLGCLAMARPQDCFAIGTPYNMAPNPDGVAGHYSMYLSLFGKDIKAGEAAEARVRLVVESGLTTERAVAHYQAFIGDRR